MQKPYPIYDLKKWLKSAQSDTLFMTKTAENHVLWGRTYLYSPCRYKLKMTRNMSAEQSPCKRKNKSVIMKSKCQFVISTGMRWSERNLILASYITIPYCIQNMTCSAQAYNKKKPRKSLNYGLVYC